MKNWILSIVAGLALAFGAACQTTDHADHSGHDHNGTAKAGGCAKCDCKHYDAGRLIKGVCRDCGHTMEEHPGH